MIRVTTNEFINNTQRLSKCKCGCGQNFIDNKLVLSIIFMVYEIERISKMNGILYITSWNRCKEHNKAVGGAKNSLHITGNAIDFVVAVVDNDNNEKLISDEVTKFFLEIQKLTNMLSFKKEIITYEKGRVHLGRG